MRDFHWRAGLRRAVLFILLYFAILYVMNVLFPESLGITSQQLPGIAINATVFFVLFTVLFAWTEKRRAQRMAESRSNKKSDPKGGQDGDETSGSSLKGRPNPNTSRKKARRRR